MAEIRTLARAPSNIAILKYMGKADASTNLPANPSLSLTLDSLCTVVEARFDPRGQGPARWIPELPDGAAAGEFKNSLRFETPRIHESGVAKFVRHAERARGRLPEILGRFELLSPDARAPGGLQGAVELRSASTFPASSGIASSASSFAALTLALAGAWSDGEAFRRAWDREPELRRALAALSREGSGSSCRSFEGPWVLWQNERSEKVDSRLPRLRDLVLLISAETKSVSSTEAHARVKTSPLWEKRPDRAARRLGALRAALDAGDLRRAARESWAELWEMHSLFHTSVEPFTYWTGATLEALRWLEPLIRTDAEPPLVTIDAGPNLHLLVPEARAGEWRARVAERFPQVTILEDRQGEGARLL